MVFHLHAIVYKHVNDTNIYFQLTKRNVLCLCFNWQHLLTYCVCVAPLLPFCFPPTLPCFQLQKPLFQFYVTRLLLLSPSAIKMLFDHLVSHYSFMTNTLTNAHIHLCICLIYIYAHIFRYIGKVKSAIH